MNRRTALKNTALIGSAATLSTTLLSLLQSCQTQDRLSWQPQFLNTDQALLVSALVDAILPTTDTPGGLDVKVDMLIDLLYAKTFNEEGQQNIRAEMDAFNAKCKARFDKQFHQLDPEQKKTILQEEEGISPKFGRGVWGYGVGPQPAVGFYRSFKSMAIMGYCTAEEIGKNVLKYDPIPGPFQGCIPFSEVGKVWTL